MPADYDTAQNRDPFRPHSGPFHGDPMPRAARSRLWTDAACYHVINRGHARETVFHDDDDCAYFLQLLQRYGATFELRLYHYCLMQNHFHLLLQLPEPRRLSRCMAGLLVAYWHHYRRRYGLVGHLFQGRFKSPAIEADSYLLSCGRYIERNPLQMGLVAEAWQYRWSSCAAYALGKSDPLLAPNVWYESLAREPAGRIQRWREFLVGDDPKEPTIRTADWVVGGAAFRRRLHRPHGRAEPRSRGRPPVGPSNDPAGRISL
jgi:putative transposase